MKGNNLRIPRKLISIGNRNSNLIGYKIQAYEKEGKLYYLCPDCKTEFKIGGNKSDILKTFGELVHKCSCRGRAITGNSQIRNKVSNKLLIKFKKDIN